MGRDESGIRRHILDVAENMLSTRESSEIRMREVSTLANVGVPTIYYYFETRNQLIAEAQVSTYFKLIEPLHQFLGLAEAGLLEGNEANFLSAVSDNVAMVWTLGLLDGGWRIVRLLLDVWSDPATKRAFGQVRDAQLNRWIDAVENAKLRGWIDDDLDVMSLITSCWTGSLGQAIFADSTQLKYSPETIRDFFMKSMREKTLES